MPQKMIIPKAGDTFVLRKGASTALIIKEVYEEVDSDEVFVSWESLSLPLYMCLDQFYEKYAVIQPRVLKEGEMLQ